MCEYNENTNILSRNLTINILEIMYSSWPKYIWGNFFGEKADHFLQAVIISSLLDLPFSLLLLLLSNPHGPLCINYQSDYFKMKIKSCDSPVYDPPVAFSTFGILPKVLSGLYISLQPHFSLLLSSFILIQPYCLAGP